MSTSGLHMYVCILVYMQAHTYAPHTQQNEMPSKAITITGVAVKTISFGRWSNDLVLKEHSFLL